jgi:hypothetical protein
MCSHNAFPPAARVQTGRRVLACIQGTLYRENVLDFTLSATSDRTPPGENAPAPVPLSGPIMLLA